MPFNHPCEQWSFHSIQLTLVDTFAPSLDSIEAKDIRRKSSLLLPSIGIHLILLYRIPNHFLTQIDHYITSNHTVDHEVMGWYYLDRILSSSIPLLLVVFTIVIIHSISLDCNITSSTDPFLQITLHHIPSYTHTIVALRSTEASHVTFW
jgi:hypothetical protein